MSLFKLYFNSFKDLSKEIWFLALVTFINRAGTMVIPFLSIYLKIEKGFTYGQIGWIMSAFGGGSMLGAWLGGKLAQSLGFYKVMYGSLFISGCFFILLQFVDGFFFLCISIFLLMVVSDAFRPASYLAIEAYSKEGNKTRSISLLRLAINLGFSFGPALGGLIIAQVGYFALFWLDGLTCIMAGLLFLSLLEKRNPQPKEKLNPKAAKEASPYRDYPFLLFIAIIFLVGFTFLQYFSTIPLYYKEIHHLNESQIGWLMFLNGMLIFLIEMPLIKFIENRSFSLFRVLTISILLIGGSFLILNLFSWIGVLSIGMLFLTFGEMLNFPFINSISLDRAKGKNVGDYMALFTMAFSLAHILGHNTGMQLIKKIGYEQTWYIMTSISLLSIALLFWYKKLTKKEHELEKNNTQND